MCIQNANHLYYKVSLILVFSMVTLRDVANREKFKIIFYYPGIIILEYTENSIVTFDTVLCSYSYKKFYIFCIECYSIFQYKFKHYIFSLKFNMIYLKFHICTIIIIIIIKTKETLLTYDLYDGFKVCVRG